MPGARDDRLMRQLAAASRRHMSFEIDAPFLGDEGAAAGATCRTRTVGQPNPAAPGAREHAHRIRLEDEPMDWTLEQAARALGAPLAGGLEAALRSARIAGVSIDSRTVARGELFFAVRGERHDAHDFVAAALGAGAVAAVVSAGRAGEFDAALRSRLLCVDDPLAALQRLAREWRMEWGRRAGGSGAARRRLAGVTGSVGKTTTKEILAALLGTRFSTLKSTGNLNNLYGVPLTLARLGEEHEAAVIEMGMSRTGEIARLAWMARPEVGVVTRVAPVHLEFFASVEEIAEAKRELIEGLAGEDPVAVLNADDPRVAAFAEVMETRVPGRVITFGMSPQSDFRAVRITECGLEGTELEFEGGDATATLRIPLLGRHNALNALAALAAASCWGIGAEEARRAFAGLAPGAMRGEVLRFEGGVMMINDCYNSSPAALAAALATLAHAPGAHRRILVAGEMLELGPASARLHRETGAQAASFGNIDWIIGVQGYAAELLRGAAAAGHPASQQRFFPSAAEAAEFLSGFAAPGDLVLLKGSRGVHLERVLEALAASRPMTGSAGAGAVEGGRH
ncbi:MAG TPA: UDP-N-acetylmuramoyl-tripeptide--D-alanyl-D-alanine ligase [Candidatus Acidoferrales bacterium]|nr:UDP-N-acetylmuramoyl-tripeptide--D-alanyl-D-alanine ligase [Candidatus Acidoferrales bacterium]